MKISKRDDIQALLFSGYNEFSGAVYLLLKVIDAAKAKSYLLELVKHHEISSDLEDSPDKPGFYYLRRMNIAFTYEGLKALQLQPSILASFPREFREGMNERARSTLLGDKGENDPLKWLWGKPEDDSTHVVLLLFAKSDRAVQILAEAMINDFPSNGLQLSHRLNTYGDFQEKFKFTKEHFGFRDGISGPFVDGFKKERGIKNNNGAAQQQAKPDVTNNVLKETPIKTGEFLLGYRNEYDQFPDSPFVEKILDPENILPVAEFNSSVKDLGRNGSFLVFRQMQQFVHTFWDYAKVNSKELVGKAKNKHDLGPLNARKFESAILLASKMVGRWPGGAPLVLAPDFDDPTLQKENKFRFSEIDPHGHACPFGAHIRRANPRDQIFSGRNKSVSDEMVRKHHMIRRGRIYGDPVAESMDPMEIMTKTDDGKERGLHFICLVGNIARQFEFVQSVWFFNPVFANMHGEVDPMFGQRDIDSVFTNSFTCQATPFNRTYCKLPQFTKMRGGAYFFLPSITALKYICT